MADIVRLPEDFVSSLRFVHPKDMAELLLSDRKPRFTTMWALTNELRPSDIYCYLGGRFGQPNGLQNFLRRDDSDNLIHWEWFLESSLGYITVAGLNFRTDVWISGGKFSEDQIASLVEQFKQEFSTHGKQMQHVRRSLEPWIEFVNPYQRLRRAVEQLVEELDELELDPSNDAPPDVLKAADRDAALEYWKVQSAKYSRATGLSFGIRSMVPVMAEAFINLVLFVLVKPSIKADKQFFSELFRLPIPVRIKSLPYFCVGFSKAVDAREKAICDYFGLVDTRNDLLHGNFSIDKLKFDELYFYGKVPIFNRYGTMWSRSLGVAHKAVGLDQVHSELAVVDAFTSHLMTLMDDRAAEQIRLFSNRFDLGVRKDTGRAGILFPGHLVDFGPGPPAEDADESSIE